MSVIINVRGELHPNRVLSEEEVEQIMDLDDGWGGLAFYCDENQSITFLTEEMNGMNPQEDGVTDPLKKLLEYAREHEFLLNGSIEISSEWDDYDNILIQVSNNQMKEENLEISNASTQQLLDELIRRNVLTYEEAETFLSRDTELERD